jgi:hypothetical protein
MSGLGPSFMNICTCRSFLRSGSRNAWTQIKNVSGASDPIDFLSRLVTMDKPGFITVTWTQSNNQWSGGIAAHPALKNSKCKNLLEKFLPRFFGLKTACSLLIIFHRAKLSTWSITGLCRWDWMTFWKKNITRTSWWSCSSMTLPQLTGHLQPRRN